MLDRDTLRVPGSRGGKSKGTHSARVLICGAVETQHQGARFERHLAESNDGGM
jgi:hypothetical protein